MATIGKRKVLISNKDLNQAILKKNKSLDVRNKTLDTNIKNKESEIKLLDKEIKSLSNGIKSLSKQTSNSESLFSKEKLKLYNIAKNVEDRESHVLTLKNQESSINKNVEKLNEETLKLNNAIAYLETKKKKADDLIQDVDYFKEQKRLLEKDLSSIKKEYRVVKDNISNQELFFKNTSIANKEKNDEMSSEFTELSEKIKTIQNDVNSAEANHSYVNVKFEKEKEEKSLELKAIESLIDKKEDEYIAWERKLENIEKSVKSENERIDKIKKNFENWKVGALEGVARMKLKNKMEKIDRAGLTEILNG